MKYDHNGLSAIDTALLAAYAVGLDDTGAAGHLGVSKTSVSNRKHKLLNRLKLKSINDAIKIAGMRPPDAERLIEAKQLKLALKKIQKSLVEIERAYTTIKLISDYLNDPINQ